MGGFSGSTDVSVGAGPRSVAIGDFNRDGKLDFAVANRGSNTVSIRMGDGLGGFSGSTDVSVGAGPRSVAIGDFNRDGYQDFAVSTTGQGSQQPGPVSIRLGDGMGGYSGFLEITGGYFLSSVAIGDFNGDSKQDFAVTNLFSGAVSIELGQCTTGPTPTPTATATATATTSPTPAITPCANASVFGENFDGVTAPALPAGWSAANAAGAAPLWVSSTAMPDTPPNAAFIDDPATVSDKRLDTPDIATSAAGLAPTNVLESAIAATLSPGPYTVLLAGLNNGTGVGLVEVYDLSN